jgi:2-keto-4-pentenoate hydratase/2-oxohepta-3-ene-1,7-dioic acid hydratase in catechol pathway
MKFLSFTTPTGATFGLTDGKSVVDLGLRTGGTLREAIRRDALSDLARHANAPADYRLDEIGFLPVIPDPAKILCVGLNYVEHRREGNHAETAKAPPVFTRYPQSQCGHLAPMVIPAESDDFDFEAEVAIVIGRAGRRIARENALAHVAGISAYNDGSVRDWQLAAGQWLPGKNFPATGAFGPWLVTPDELPADRSLRLQSRLNGQVMQDATTDLMMFPIPDMIAHLSTFLTLEPGDVIVTGTPGGVGFRRSPPVYMKPGDVVEIEVEGVGILRNPVVKEGA